MDRLKGSLDYALKRQWERENKIAKGFIYLIQCHDFTKVGYADKIAIRLSAFQTGCPYKLRLLASWRSDSVQRDEARLHELWRKYEVRGEWFQVPAGELACVMNATKFEDIFTA